MSLEHSPARAGNGVTSGGNPDDPDYWFKLIDEVVAAEFLDVTPRKMQADRQKGGGARYVRLSSRCIKYRRHDLREYSEARLRSSTSDTGPEAPAA